MERATVKWFSNVKGFGFLSTSQGDLFVHHTAIEGEGFRALKGGQLVEFEAGQTERGLQAVRVRRLGVRGRPRPDQLTPPPVALRPADGVGPGP